LQRGALVLSEADPAIVAIVLSWVAGTVGPGSDETGKTTISMEERRK
jgi:hypothetical protein